jgi:hypothetical protein
MSVVSRKFSACPVRTASQTWEAIIGVIAVEDVVRNELSEIGGIAASLIADESPKSDPITIIGSGSRLRIYCLYDQEGSTDDANEAPLTWKLFEGDWEIHFPVEKSDLEWVTNALKPKGAKFKTYETGTAIINEEQPAAAASQLTINLDKLKSHGY